MSRMTDKRRKEKPTKEQVQGWIKSGDWGGPGIEPLINNACWVAEAYLECLGEIDRQRELLRAWRGWYDSGAVVGRDSGEPYLDTCAFLDGEES